ncbi:hypothetical protein ABK040_010153 [Willaertia magna]
MIPNDNEDGGEEEYFDEFGNYGGRNNNNAALSSDEELSEQEENNRSIVPIDGNRQNAIVLHEDKEYYPSAEEVYGEEVETLVEDEDRQTLETPIIEPIKKLIWNKTEKNFEIPPETTFTWDYLLEMTKLPSNIRNVSFVGNLHHGKTCFMDMLVRSTHIDYTDYQLDVDLKYTDIRPDEYQRGLSIKSTPMTLLLESTRQKTFLVNIMDTPGHTNFSDEVTSAMRISDGVVVIVDALEGVMSHTENLIKFAVRERLPIVLLINKIDRLILELKLPPTDAYFKLKHTITEVNNILKNSINDESLKYQYILPNNKTIGKEENNKMVEYPTTILSPELGNVCFASSKTGVCFTLESFAKIYADYYGGFSYKEFAKRLWGDIYFDSERRTFSRKPSEEGSSKRSFIEFILEPLYKIYSHIVGQDPEELEGTLRKIGVKLNDIELSLDPNPLMKCVFRALFGKPSAFVDMLERFIPPPNSSYLGNRNKVESFYTGPQDSNVANNMKNCNNDGDLVVYITKLFPRPDYSTFDAFGRVMSGTIKRGDTVRVLGEGYSPLDEEDMLVNEVSNLWIYNGRYQLEVDSIGAGNWILIGGVESIINKTATIVPPKKDEEEDETEYHIFKPLSFINQSVIKIAVEPLKPSELPKMMEGLRKINKSYPLAITRVEESGEHIILGTGELYLDTIMHDLRTLYAKIEIKVSDPSVTFCETVAETSSVRCFATTPNLKNRLVMIAEPMEKGLAEDIEHKRIRFEGMDKSIRDEILMTKYEWDEFSCDRIWAFGPEEGSPNILINETFEHEVDQTLLNSVKDSIIQGFRWSTKEGPLCDEPIRNVKFRLLEADISQDRISRGSGQIISTSRRVCYSSFLSANPQLLEPIYSLEIQCPYESIQGIYKVLERRRGHINEEIPKPGTPHYILKGFVPAIDSFGLETDLRMHTQGHAFCLSNFSHWDVVPGNPLDKDIVLAPLEPSPLPHLARDFMIKTRRRKGLSDDISQFTDLDLIN